MGNYTLFLLIFYVQVGRLYCFIVVFDGEVGNYFNGHVCNKIFIYRKTINHAEPHATQFFLIWPSPPHLDACHNCPISGAESQKKYILSFALMSKTQMPINRGVFYISKLFVYCHIRGMRSTHTLTSIFKPSNHPTINCIKSLHNSKNHFDNHFDTSYNFPLTNTTNKLSVNFKTSHFSKIPMSITSFSSLPRNQ